MKTWQVLAKLKQGRPQKRRQEVVQVLLANRGIKGKKAMAEFFQPRHPDKISLKEVGILPKEMIVAVKRIQSALEKREGIIVYGDYDADGICGTAILWEVLEKMGARALPYIPERITEGYGLNIESIKNLKKEDPELGLIVTVDHGIVSHKKVKKSTALGVDVIITDHHQPTKTRPRAAAIVHTTKISGSAVAWMLARELAEKAKLPFPNLELVAIGTIADLLPLVGPNRSFVKHGLDDLQKTSRPGLLALFDEAGIKPEAIAPYEVGFIIAPRLNAMGRLEHALDSLRLVCTRDSARAQALAQKLGETNRRRQLLTDQTLIHARERYLAQASEATRLIFVHHHTYEHGVVGLVAGRLAEEFYLPAIVVSVGEEESRASARSIPGFDIVAAIRVAEDVLEEVGGHPMAAGFTVKTENLDRLKAMLGKYVAQTLPQEKLSRKLKIDCQLDFSDLNRALYQAIAAFIPFGVGNPEPVFKLANLSVLSAQTAGIESAHLRLRVADTPKTSPLKAIAFGRGELIDQIEPGGRVDLAANLSLSRWNQKEELELKVKDIKPV